MICAYCHKEFTPGISPKAKYCNQNCTQKAYYYRRGHIGKKLREKGLPPLPRKIAKPRYDKEKKWLNDMYFNRYYYKRFFFTKEQMIQMILSNQKNDEDDKKIILYLRGDNSIPSILLAKYYKYWTSGLRYDQYCKKENKRKRHTRYIEIDPHELIVFGFDKSMKMIRSGMYTGNFKNAVASVIRRNIWPLRLKQSPVDIDVEHKFKAQQQKEHDAELSILYG